MRALDPAAARMLSLPTILGGVRSRPDPNRCPRSIARRSERIARRGAAATERTRQAVLPLAPGEDRPPSEHPPNQEERVLSNPIPDPVRWYVELHCSIMKHR
jgi:hypothetical protein